MAATLELKRHIDFVNPTTKRVQSGTITSLSPLTIRIGHTGVTFANLVLRKAGRTLYTN